MSAADRPVRPIKAARAEALRQFIELRGGRIRLTRSMLHQLDDHGLSRGLVDAAADQLVKAGAARLRAEDGRVVIELPGGRS